MKRLQVTLIALFMVQSVCFAQYGWQRHDVKKNFNGARLEVVDTTKAYLCNSSGSILKTTDKGKSWTEIRNVKGPGVDDVYFSNDANGFFCTYGDMFSPNNALFSTSDSGKTWNGIDLLDSGKASLSDIFFLDQNTGWIAGSITFSSSMLQGSKGLVLKTTNAGNSWDIFILDTINPIRQVQFLDKSFGWGVTGSGEILYTSTGGKKWIVQERITDLYHQTMHSLHFFNEYSGIVLADKDLLYTSDAGTTWNKYKWGFSDENNTAFRDMFFIDGNTGWIAAGCGIFKTTDAGKTWKEQTYKDSTRGLECIGFFDKKTGVAVGIGIGLRTMSGGEPVPPLDASIMGQSSLCLGDSIVLSANPAGSDYSYSWSTGEKTQKISVSKAGKYIVSVEGSDGRTGIDTINVMAFPKPVAEITGDSTICKGSAAALSASGDFDSYLWSTGDTTKSINAVKDGQYSLIVTDYNGCRDTASFSLTVIEPKITFDDMASHDFKYVTIGTSKIMHRKIFNNGSYEINILSALLKNNKDFSISLSKTLPAIIQPGDSLVVSIDFHPLEEAVSTDTLIIAMNEPCLQSFSFTETGNGTTTGVGEHESLSEIKVELLPNPAKTQAEIIVTGEGYGIISVGIYSMEGIKIRKAWFNKADKASNYLLDLNDYPAGVYELIIQCGKSYIAKRLVVLK